MTINELVDLKNIRALFVVFFNVIKDDKLYFYIGSRYKRSKFSPNDLSALNYPNLNQGLSSYFDLNFEMPSPGNHFIKIRKTLEINTVDKFLLEVYKQIQLLSFSIETKEYEKSALLALFTLRGSPDFSHGYYAVDIRRRYSSKEYFRNIFQILSGFSSISQLNLNFRELQPQFTAGSNKRDTQIRINLGWFWQELNSEIRKINKYKYLILSNNLDKIPEPSKRVGNFSDRLVEYLNNILGEGSSLVDVENERRRLGLRIGESQTRDYSLRELAINIFPDECMACKDKFQKEDRTFKLRGRNQYYFEIHHIIPFSKGKEHDQIDNLAKICPTCHRALTKNRAEKELQKETIRSILSNYNNAKRYVGVLVGDVDIDNLVDFVYAKLV